MPTWRTYQFVVRTGCCRSTKIASVFAGSPDWQLSLWLLLAWAIVLVIIIRGVRSSGKAAYFLAIFPYVVIITLLIQACTLPGAVNGILFFIKPQFGELLNPKVRSCATFVISAVNCLVGYNRSDILDARHPIDQYKFTALPSKLVRIVQ